MYDYVRNSLYGAEDANEMEQLRDEVEEEIIRDEVTSYNNKLIASIELEKYYSCKLKEVSKLIVELKEKSRELTDLKAARDSLNNEYKLNPNNKETKEQVLDVEGEYYYQMDNFINKITDVLKVDLSELVAKHKIEYSKLITVLKEYRSKIKEEIETKRSEREKIITIMEKGLYSKFDSKLGTEVSNILKGEAGSYNATMQQELKKHGLYQTEEVLLKLKMLTAMYGYKKSEITPEFIQMEMNNIKSKVKLYMPMYRNIKSDLNKISESRMLQVKLVFINEAKENVELKIGKLEERREEIEVSLKKDEEQREVEKLKYQNIKRKREISELRNAKKICLEKNGDGVAVEGVQKIEDEIIRKRAEIRKNDKKIEKIINTRQQIIMLGSILGISGLQFVTSPKDRGEDDEDISEVDLDTIDMDDEEDKVEDVCKDDEKIVLFTSEEVKNMRDELSKIKVNLKELKEELEYLNGKIESTKNVVEKYEELKEQREEKKNNIIEELEKYDIFKDLTEALDKSEDGLYKHLYI